MKPVPTRVGRPSLFALLLRVLDGGRRRRYPAGATVIEGEPRGVGDRGRRARP